MECSPQSGAGAAGCRSVHGVYTPRGYIRKGIGSFRATGGRCNYDPGFTELRASMGSLSRDELVALLGSD